MTKEQAIQIMVQLQSVVKATPQEHQIVSEAINFLSTLEQPKKATEVGQKV